MNINKKLPVLFRVLASVGVVATGYLSVSATIKALNETGEIEKKDISTKERFKKVWRHYLPPFLVGVGTIGCMVASGKISEKYYEALSSTYILLNEAKERYESNNKDINGEEAHKKVIASLVDDPQAYSEETNYTPIYATSIFDRITTDFGEPNSYEYCYFYEPISKRTFKSTPSRVMQALYHLNRNLVLRGDANLNEYWTFLGIDNLPEGDDLGWNCCTGDYLWIDFEIVEANGSTPSARYYVINIINGPEPNYDEDF